MNRLQSNDLCIIVSIQYAIGFELIDGKIEIETTIFNKTQVSRVVPAIGNRINIFEDFIWKTDKKTIKYCRTNNEIVKIECFIIPEYYHGNICRRKRIGQLIIKLRDFQIIGRDWEQDVSIRGYKLQGSKSYYELRLILIIQEDIDFIYSTKQKNRVVYNNKACNSNDGKQQIECYKRDFTKIKNTTIYPRNQEHIDHCNSQSIKNNRTNQSNKRNTNHSSKTIEKQENPYQEMINNCEEIINNLKTLRTKDNKSKKSWKKGMHELHTTKKIVENSINESKESLKVYEHNECKFKELLKDCLKCTEEWYENLKKIKKDLEKNYFKKYSSSSSSQSESDLENTVVIAKELKKKLNELTECMVIDEQNKNKKTKHTREISNLKNTICILSNLCDQFIKKIFDEF